MRQWKALFTSLAALLLVSQQASAQGPDSSSRFACKTVHVDMSVPGTASRVPAQPPKALLDALAKAGLKVEADSKKADLLLSFLVRAEKAGLQEEFIISATITSLKRKGDSSRLEPQSYTSTSLRQPERPLLIVDRGWSTFAEKYVEKPFQKGLQDFLTKHQAGVWVSLAPPDATLTFQVDGSLESASSPNTLGCLSKGARVTVVAEREGYKRYEQSFTTESETDGRTVRASLEQEGKSVSTGSTGGGGGVGSSSSSSSSSSSGIIPPTTTPGGDYVWIAGGGAAVLLLVLIIVVARSRKQASPTPQPVTRPEVHPPQKHAQRLKVLYLAANPQRTDRLRLDQEARSIAEKLREGTYHDVIDFIPEQAVRFGDLQRALLEHKPQIVHFGGHADDKGIVLEAESGEPVHVGRKVLEDLFKSFDEPEDRIRVVLLNACYSAELGRALQDIVDVTIGTTRSLPDEGAIAFAAGFYRAISFGRSAQNAYEQGKVAALASTERRAHREIGGSGAGAGDGGDEDLFTLLVKEGVDATQMRLVGKHASDGAGADDA